MIVDETGSIRWPVLLGRLAKYRVQLTQLRPDVFPLSVPRLGASDEAIAAAESRVGQLDAQHASLLRQADGWWNPFMSGNVLPADQLGIGELWDRGQEHLDIFCAQGPSATWPPRDELIPLFISEYETGVMAVWIKGPITDGGHPVYWLAGELVDTFANVYDWWMAMAELVRLNAIEYGQKVGIAID